MRLGKIVWKQVRTAYSFSSAFEPRFWILSKFIVHKILEMSDSSSEGLIPVKKWILSREHDAL